MREAVAIQKIIQVTSPTATMERLPPMNSWASNGQALGAEGEEGAEAERDGNRECDAGPDPAEQVTAAAS